MVRYSEREKNSYFTKNPDPGGSGSVEALTVARKTRRPKPEYTPRPRDYKILIPFGMNSRDEKNNGSRTVNYNAFALLCSRGEENTDRS